VQELHAILSDMRTGRVYLAFAVVLTVASLATIAGLTHAGGDYYRLPLVQRVRSPMHAAWKPGGTIGKRLGVIGTGLMLVNLAYMARRRWRVLQGVGSTRIWLEAHIFCGLTGPAILVFHSAFLAQNLVARVTAASTALVVGAGVIGRYLYAQLPRDIAGRELLLSDLEGERRALALELRAALPAGESAIADALLSDAADAPAAESSTVGLSAGPSLVLASVRGDLARWAESFQVARRLRDAGLPRAEAARAASLARRVAGVRLRIAHLGAFRRILALWRDVHVSLAAVMILCIVIHVAVVSALGYGVW